MHVAISKMANCCQHCKTLNNLRLIVLAAVVLCFVLSYSRRELIYTELPGYLVSFSQSMYEMALELPDKVFKELHALKSVFC